MGTANCGSTLLTKVLARHPELATIGELKASAIPDIETYQCGCGERLLACGFWEAVAEKCRAQGFEFSVRNFKTRIQSEQKLADRILKPTIHGSVLESLRSLAMTIYPAAKNGYRESLKRNVILIDAICEVENNPAFLDGSKDPTRAVHFARSGLFDVRVIHLVRDGRAVVSSYKKRHPDHANNIKMWKDKTEECERAKKYMPEGSVKRFRYEDFCANPNDILREMLEFCGVDASVDLLDDSQVAPQHIIGHGMRLSGIGQISERKEWPKSLTKDELELFEQRGGTVNRQYNYQ